MSDRNTKDVELQFAAHQLLGYTHAKRGYSLISLIQSMGLYESEWEELDKSTLDLTETEVSEINEYFDSK